MAELRELYQEVILDHSKKPRNFGPLPGATHQAEGFNPLCGDRVTVYLKVNEGVVEEVSFDGKGCAISTASASMMTESLKGKSLNQAEELFQNFHEMVTGLPGNCPVPKCLGKLCVFSGVCEFPSRVKCAVLCWHTLVNAAKGVKETVITE